VLRILDRHVLREWLKVFAIVTAACIGLLMLQILYDAYPDMRSFGASQRQMLLYFLVRAPASLSIVIPIAVLVSLLYALGQLHRHNEITAMRAAGISLWRVTGGIWVVAGGLSVLLFYLNATVIPWSVEQARILWDNMRFSHQAAVAGSGDEVGLVYNVTYDNRVEGRLWMIPRFSEYSHRAFGVHLAFLDKERREVRRITAAEGYWDEVDRKWVLMHGRETWFDPQTRDIVRTLAFERRELEGVRDDPMWMILLEKRPKDLSFFELQSIIEAPEMADNPRLPAYKVRYHSLLAGTFSCLIVAGLAIPFAVTGVRVNPAVGVSKSLGLFVLYYLFTTFGTLLGEQGALDARVAAWLPNVVGILVALWFSARAR